MISSASATASTVTPAATRRAAWARAEQGLSEAQKAVAAHSFDTGTANILTGPIARRTQHVKNGGNPAVWDSEVQFGRTMLRNVLTGRGDTPEAAEQKIAALEAAYVTYQSTPEAR